MTRHEDDDAANAALTAALDALRAAGEQLHAPRARVLLLLHEHADRRAVVRGVRDALVKIAEHEINAVHDFAQRVGRC